MDKPDRPGTAVPTVIESAEAKTERFALVRHELAELQRRLSDANQRLATELQGRAEDADRFEELEARLQAHELKANEDAARIADLGDQNSALRSRLESAGTTAEELRRQVEARDARLEESLRKQREQTEQLESHETSLRDTRTQLAARQGELATTLGERDTERAERERLEGDLAVAQSTHRELTELLETNASSLREAKGLLTDREAELATRTTELATRTTERDEQEEVRLRVEEDLATTRRTLDAARARMQELAEQIFKLGQAMVDVSVTGEARGAAPERAVEAPPLAPPPPPIPEARPEAVIAAAAPSRARGAILVLGGLAVGAAVTLGAVQLRASRGSTAKHPTDAEAPGATQFADPVGYRQPTPPAIGTNAQPAATADASPSGAAPPATAQPAGVILLPPGADGHRVYVDDRQVLPKNGRVEVPCGPHKVQIGSRSEARMLDVACSGETALPDLGTPP